ncbi:M23 family metallopeptidase [Minwuia thermotolerans]|nr:M23 family metallopeptidase [Minwuia thermotolerans]
MTAFARMWGRVYRDRQIFVRTDGRLRFLRVSSGLQIFVSGVALGTLLWAGIATWTASEQQAMLVQSRERMGALERDRTRLGGELGAVRAQYSNATTEIVRQYRELHRLIATRGVLERDLVQAQTRLAEVETAFHVALNESRELDQHLGHLRQRLQVSVASNHLMETRLREAASALAGANRGRQQEAERRRAYESRLSALESALMQSTANQDVVRQRLYEQQQAIETVEGSRDVARAEIRQMSSRIAALTSDLDQTQRSNASLRKRLASTADALTRTHEEQIEAERKGYRLASTVSSLEGRLDQVRQTQLELLRGIRSKAQRNIAALEATLQMTEIPLNELLEATHAYRPGIGGPMIALDDEGLAEDESFESMVGTLEMDLLRWEAMQELLENAPLARPTTTGYVSSEFGPRKDPITGRRAVHKGIDIAAPARTPIYATARGLVTFAGRKSAYGRLVEIDHGYGFVTRYAHLRSIDVEAGQSVEFHDQVGTMGSSGRSTGSHVHYEVLFQGEQVDPSNFLRAGRYVFKVKDASG